MNCGYCGEENPEKAVFCKKCGRRLDGMALCGACGAFTPADGEFCVQCGSNRNAPVYAMPLRFPAVRGAEKTAKAAEKRRASAGISAEKGLAASPAQTEQQIVREGKAAAILHAVSFWCFAAAALVGMIFVFLIGLSVNVGKISTGVGGYDIFYFFGDAYSGAKNSDALTTGAALGTVCSVFALAGTVGCFIFTVVRAVLILLKKTEKGLAVPAAATFFAYACGAALLSMCMTQSAETAGVTVGYGLNDATVAGLVIGAIVLAAAMGMRGWAVGIQGGVRTYAVNLLCGVVLAALLLACVGVMGMGAVSFSLSSEYVDVSSSSTFGISPFFTQLAALGTGVVSGLVGGEEHADSSVYDTCSGMMVMLAVAACLACVFAVLACARLFSVPGKNVSKQTVIFAATSGGLCVLAGIAMCVAGTSYAAEMGEAYAAGLVQPIILMVLGVFVCVAAVVGALPGRRHAADGVMAEVPSEEAQEI